MKNIKFIFAILALSLTLYSCEDDGGTSKVALIEGAVPNLIKSSTLDGFINLVKLNAGTNVQIGFKFDVALGDVASADIVAFHRRGTVYTGPIVVKSGVTTFPYDFTITRDGLIAAFPNISSAADFLLADEFIFSARLTLKDGSVLNVLNKDGSNNYGSDISSSSKFKVKIGYSVSCPSSLGGTYKVISNGTNTDGQPAAVNLPYTVTVTDLGGGSYQISDGVAGVYIFWYSIYGYTFETKGNFKDVCTNLSGSWTESFGCGITLTGKDNGNGTLTINWENCFGDKCTAIYTKQ